MERIITKMETAINSKDADLVEETIDSVHEFVIITGFVPLLIELLLCDWHYRHEDIVLVLQKSKDNRAIKSLHKTTSVKFKYLEYNNSYALARKCTWALADIGTDESKKALEDIANGMDGEVAKYAQSRIDNWDSELKRKGQ